MLNGSCLCGAITFTAPGDVAAPSACHCGQCRKQSGHVWASAFAPQKDVAITGAVTWFRSSDIARRGFCGTCGSVLFWKRDDEDTVSFSCGSLDGATGLKLGRHIFVADKGDYYDITDDLPQRD